MPKVAPCLTFDGNCADTMRFYERTLGGKQSGRVLMACDATLDEPYEAMKGVAIALNYPTAAEARRVFDALAEAGEVRVQLQPTYHAEAFGKLVDRYGASWMIGGGPLNT
jgi:PhnB protein